MSYMYRSCSLTCYGLLQFSPPPPLAYRKPSILVLHCDKKKIGIYIMLKLRTYLILTLFLKISVDVLRSKIYLNQMSPYRPLKKQVSCISSKKQSYLSLVSQHWSSWYFINLFCQEEFEGSDVESAWSDTEFSWSNKHSQNSVYPPTIHRHHQNSADWLVDSDTDKISRAWTDSVCS